MNKMIVYPMYFRGRRLPVVNPEYVERRSVEVDMRVDGVVGYMEIPFIPRLVVGEIVRTFHEIPLEETPGEGTFSKSRGEE